DVPSEPQEVALQMVCPVIAVGQANNIGVAPADLLQNIGDIATQSDDAVVDQHDLVDVVEQVGDRVEPDSPRAEIVPQVALQIQKAIAPVDVAQSRMQRSCGMHQQHHETGIGQHFRQREVIA